MSISSSLNAGVMGLNVNATRLATISDNIANSATYGYKRSQVDFSSMVLRQRSSAYSAGGVSREYVQGYFYYRLTDKYGQCNRYRGFRSRPLSCYRQWRCRCPGI